MGLAKVAGRYAAAMFNVARDANALEAATRDMALVGRACTSSPALVEALRNPIIPASKKWSVAEKIFGPKVSALTLKFLKFAADKDRLGLLPELSRAFLKREEAHRGVTPATLWTARPLPAEVVDNLRSGLEKKHRRRFSIRTLEDRGLIGGFRLLIGDKVFDCTVRHQLESLESAFAGTH